MGVLATSVVCGLGAWVLLQMLREGPRQSTAEEERPAELSHVSSLVVYRDRSEPAYFVARPEDIAAFSHAVFSRKPVATGAAEAYWDVENWGPSGAVLALDSNGEVVMNIVYRDRPAWTPWGLIAGLAGDPGSVAAVQGEHRKWVLGPSWRKWVRHVAARYPRLAQVGLLASARCSVESALHRARGLGLDAQAAYWGTTPFPAWFATIPITVSARSADTAEPSLSHAEASAREKARRLMTPPERLHVAAYAVGPVFHRLVDHAEILEAEMRAYLAYERREFTIGNLGAAGIQGATLVRAEAGPMAVLLLTPPTEEQVSALQWAVMEEDARGLGRRDQDLLAPPSGPTVKSP